jgi:hypothetical protein
MDYRSSTMRLIITVQDMNCRKTTSVHCLEYNGVEIIECINASCSGLKLLCPLVAYLDSIISTFKQNDSIFAFINII